MKELTRHPWDNHKLTILSTAEFGLPIVALQTARDLEIQTGGFTPLFREEITDNFGMKSVDQRRAAENLNTTFSDFVIVIAADPRSGVANKAVTLAKERHRTVRLQFGKELQAKDEIKEFLIKTRPRAVYVADGGGTAQQVRGILRDFVPMWKEVMNVVPQRESFGD